jgi:transposase
MESTGVYWKPIDHRLADPFCWRTPLRSWSSMRSPSRRFLDARPLGATRSGSPICRWHGLLRGSFIPPATPRELRDLTRQRTTLVAERARPSNRLQKALEDTHLKLASVVTNILGQSARAMVDALVAGETDPLVLAHLAQGRLQDGCARSGRRCRWRWWGRSSPSIAS